MIKYEELNCGDVIRAGDLEYVVREFVDGRDRTKYSGVRMMLTRLSRRLMITTQHYSKIAYCFMMLEKERKLSIAKKDYQNVRYVRKPKNNSLRQTLLYI